MTDSRKISISPEAMLPLLAEQLYGAPEVFIRELVCNSFDAIERRIALPDQEHAPRRIVLRVSDGTTIRVEDTGIGMTELEMHQFLGCIGKSATRAFRAENRRVIGQFGIGFLSAIAVAESIRIETLSAIEAQQPRSWIWNGGTDYRVAPARRSTVGTAVTIELKPRFREFADTSRLRQIVEHHLPYLSVSIEIATLGDIRKRSPWADIETMERFRRGLNPRDFPQVPDDSLYVFSTSWAGGGALLGFHSSPLQGTGRLTIYQNGVLVDPDNTSLLPRAWRWVSGAVDSTAANLQLHRGAIRDDRSYHRLRARLCGILGEELARIATNDLELFSTLIDKHRTCIAELMLEDPDLLHAIGGLYPFTTTLGVHPFHEISRLSARHDGMRAIYFITVPPPSEVRWSAARAAQRLVIWCRNQAEVGLLCALGERAESMEVLELSWEMVVEPTESAETLPPYLQRWLGRLQDLFADHAIEIEAMHLQPTSVPAIAQLPDLPVESGTLTSGSTDDAAHIIESFLGALVAPAERSQALGRLIVNPQNPVVTTLASLPDSRCPLALSASLLLTTGVVQSGLAIPEAWLPSLERLVAEGSRSLMTSRHGDEEVSHTVCFFAHSFGAQKHVLDHLRALLEHSPYFWEVRSAVDLQADPRLYDNVCVQIAHSHVVIADLSDRNPNVLLELGLALGLKDEREVIVIANRASYRSFSDISGRLVHLYDTGRRGRPTRSFGPMLHRYLASAPDYRYARKQYPFLGYRLLSERGILSTDEIRTLGSKCADPIEFLAAPDRQLSANTRIPSRKLERARAYFSERIRQHRHDADRLEASFSPAGSSTR